MANKIKQVLKFSATWCVPCKNFAPIFDEVSKDENFKDIEFKSLDAEDEDAYDIVEKYKIISVPTVLLIDENDEIIKRISGTVSKTSLIEIINDTING